MSHFIRLNGAFHSYKDVVAQLRLLIVAIVNVQACNAIGGMHTTYDSQLPWNDSCELIVGEK